MRKWTVAGFMLAGMIYSGPLLAQNTLESQIQQLERQVQAQAEELAQLRERLDQADAAYGVTTIADPGSCSEYPIRRLPVVAEAPLEFDCAANLEEPAFFRLNYFTDYDEGIVFRPFDSKQYPFELKFNGWGQVRYHAFGRDVDSWTDNAGVTRPVRNRDAFDVERARLKFSGYALDPRLSYVVLLDGDTDGRHAVDFFYYYWAWQFRDSFQVQLGKRKVPGSRQWLMSSRRTRLVDRPMAGDFFRPDLTVGIFGVGNLGDAFHYEVMVGNGYYSSNSPNASEDNSAAFAFTSYIDPWGDFGGQIVDYDYSEQLKGRFGHSFVYSPQQGIVDGTPLDEADYIRLSDGTRLTETGALAPGVTVDSFDICLYTLDAAVKWRGWSFDSEFFLRWIENIEGDGALPRDQLFQYGFFAEGGKFLIPSVLDVNARYSQVSGQFGTGATYGAGLNWYPIDRSNIKLSLDVIRIDGSPLQNTASDIMVGDTGTLVRTQFQVEF